MSPIAARDRTAVLSVVCLLLTTGSVLAQGAIEVGIPSVEVDGYPRRSGVDVLHYEIALELPASGREITGRTTILYEADRSSLHPTLDLDFGPMTVDSVRVDGRRAEFLHAGEKLTVRAPREPIATRHTTSVWYHGEPQDGLIIQPNRHGDVVVFADNWPDRARYWFPAIDHPSDKATVAFEVVAPEAWQVVANGYRHEQTKLENGRVLTRWIETASIPTYCMVLGAAPFSVTNAGVVNGVEVTHWTYRADSLAGEAAFSRSTEILSFYDSLFGPFPYEKLAHVQSSTRYGGMENASAIFYGESAIGDALEAGAGNPGPAADGLTSLVAHETVHQWFGDAVTENDWHHLWLSEGFASYFAAVFFEFHGSSTGNGPSELARRMRGMTERILAYHMQNPEPIYVQNRREYESLLTPNNYQKGAWVLHMLRRRVGDQAFFDAVRSFYGELRGQTAWTADFERVAERASGMDLGWFFAQWVGRPGMPVLVVDRQADRLIVRQLQPGDPYRLDLELGLATDTGERRLEVEMTAGEVEVDLEPFGAVTSVEIDPDGWLLYATPDQVQG